MNDVLEELHVRDLALVEEAWHEFAPGMTVLTGETGAGKTALVGALKLLVGERADSTLVRAGADETLVEGRFRMDGKEVLARRRLSVDGRSRCTIDGELATVSALSSKLGPFVDLHGQHDHQALLRPTTHVDYLDHYGDRSVADARAAYQTACARHEEACRDLEVLQAALSDAERQADYLRFVVDEIAAADPRPSEDEELERRVPSLRHAERLTASAADTFAALREDGGGAEGLARALSMLATVSGLDPALDDLAERLSDVHSVVDEIGSDLRRYAEGIDHDPRALDDVESRLAILANLKKKYGPTLADVASTKLEAEETLGTLESGERAVEEARDRVVQAEETLRQVGARLDLARRKIAPEFEAALASASHELAMEGVRFKVSFTSVEFGGWGHDGSSRIEFLYAPAPEEPARPLARVASGGEVSRVMLALKSVLGTADTTPILVFDEIDTGIGGSTASSVGRRLAQLAESHQVLVVTHLAQVAVFADRHLVVQRGLADGRATTSVLAVEGEDRVAEIARMLSGGETNVGLAHARELLQSARAASADVST